MERILTAEQMRVADSYTISNLGVSEEILVERAGIAVAEEIMCRFQGGRVLVCVGKGNNGADGKVVARLLSKRHGFNVSTLSVHEGNFEQFDNKYDIIIDCIFGTGLNRQVEGKYKDAITKINNSNAFVVSCDIPSGLNSDNGIVLGVAVKAKLTIAIQDYKTGHFLNDGPDYCGEIVVKDIGISVWDESFIMRLSYRDAFKFFPKKERNTHKGNFGKTTVFGGSKNYPGSVFLSLLSLSALKSGVGYTNLAIPESLYQAYALKNPECTILTVKDADGTIVFDQNALDKLLKYDSIAIGMGLGVSLEVYKTIEYLLKNYEGKLIIDADGLNSIAKYGLEVLNNKKCKVILTPHVGEFCRLAGLDKESVLSNPIEAGKIFAKRYDIILVLKNAVSIITDGTQVYLNTTGCSGMAKGGSGDVLSGFIAGVVANTNETLEAVSSACFVFGLAGEIAQKNDNAYTMTATDIINCLGKAINMLNS
ncbi:MAG: NAD(P)H-hydrate dehydratase [Clostridia bacterium]|nr:NAD(P)H-hydrate dehydratase [Clostridia bacterium]